MTTDSKTLSDTPLSQTEIKPNEPIEQAHAADSKQTDPREWGWLEASQGKLAAGLVFGLIFGFLLQKGGVAKFDILIGVLLLENFVVVKVMLTAIIVGLVGCYLLRRFGMIELDIVDS